MSQNVRGEVEGRGQGVRTVTPRHHRYASSSSIKSRSSPLTSALTPPLRLPPRDEPAPDTPPCSCICCKRYALYCDSDMAEPSGLVGSGCEIAHSWPCSDLSVVSSSTTLETLTMPGKSVQSSKFLPTPFTLERSQPLVQQHVPFTVVLARKADGSLCTTVVQALVRSLIVVAA